MIDSPLQAHRSVMVFEGMSALTFAPRTSLIDSDSLVMEHVLYLVVPLLAPTL